ncbi:MAG: GNAT family N-acetyltransferase [Spirochaetales bacterium]|nr:GNAT family N-acetyltransferase [Spirochaetales bacterium]
MKHLSGIVARLEAECFPRPWSEEMIAGTLENGCLLLYRAGQSLFLSDPLPDGPFTDSTESYEGYVLAQDIAGDLEILRMAILPPVRGQGKGEKLLGEFLAAVRKKRGTGSWKILLEVSENNLVARKLYARCGFQLLSHRKNYYPGGEAALILQRLEIV